MPLHVVADHAPRQGAQEPTDDGSLGASGQAADHDTLLALTLDGEPLAIDHGFPCRLIAPNRPGVLQTKWVGRLTVRSPR